MIPTLILDLDGTLVDSVPDLAAALNRSLTRRDLPGFTETEVAAMVGDGASALVRRAYEARGRSPDDDALPGFLRDYARHAAVATRPYPGVPETLNRLHHDGWRLAICTNKPEAPTLTLLDALGLRRHFAAICCGDGPVARKPDPAHPLETLRLAGGDPAAAVLVGDHHNDVLAAKAAGLPVIHAAWGYGRPEMGAEADALADTFAEVPALASRLMGCASARTLEP